MNRRGFFAQTAAAGASALNLRAFQGKAGFHRLAKAGEKWTVLDPRGNPVYLRGMNHYGDGSYMPLNLNTRYGSREAWRRSVRDRHRELGFTYMPPSIGPSETTDKVAAPERTDTGDRRWPVEIRRTPEWPAADFASLDYPFTALLEYPRQYMAGKGLPDVFSEEFRDAVDKRCREFVEPLKDNPNLVGYHFCHNPPWHYTNPSFRQWIVDTVWEGQPGRKEWGRLMKRIYGSVERWRRTYGIPIESFDDIDKIGFPLRGYISKATEIEDQIAFMKRICEEWYKVYSGTVRKYDDNHLVLGDRNTLHLSTLPEWSVTTMGRYVDVVSINVMGPADIVFERLEQVTRHWDGPILMADTGASIYNGEYGKAGFPCRDIGEYEDVYRSYMEAGISHPQLVGAGWCGYYETPSSRGGVVDSRNDELLADRAAVLKKWNRWMDERYPEAIAGYEARG